MVQLLSALAAPAEQGLVPGIHVMAYNIYDFNPVDPRPPPGLHGHQAYVWYTHAHARTCTHTHTGKAHTYKSK